MTADLKPYPAMKDSGVPWLGEVPTYWEVVRLRNTSEMRVSNVDKHAKDGEQPVRLCNYVDVYKNDRIRSGMAFMRATATTDEIERFRLQSGDVLITKDSEAWNDIGVPALVEDTQDDTVSGYHLALLRPFPERVDGGYLFRALQSPAVAYQFHVEANGVTRYGLSHSAIRSVWLPLPPLHEQAAIVRFLDHADRRIRRYIRAKQKLIALLEEQKQAVIHEAVTGQIDVRTGQPYPSYKSSGVEWLGDVPAHWEVKRVKQAAQVLRGKFTHRPRNDPSLYDGPYPFIQTGEVARAERAITSYRQTLNERGLAASRLFPAGTLVMTIAANIGDVAVLDFEACFPDSVVGFVPRGDIERDFLYYVFRAMRPELLREAPVNTQGNLNVDRIGSRGIAVAPAHEQRLIARQIEASTDGLNTATNRANREIELLREYRARLIADVVTGKLDVRAAAAELPEVDPLAAEEDPDDGANQEAWSHGDEVGVTGQEAEA